MTPKMTPEEACRQANVAGNQRLQEFITQSSVLELEQFCHCLDAGNPRNTYFPLARIAIDIKLAEEADRAAQKLIAGTDTLVAETKTLVKLTHRLYILTAVLIFLGAFEVIKFILGIFCHPVE